MEEVPILLIPLKSVQWVDKSDDPEPFSHQNLPFSNLYNNSNF